jgi:hypothetical protein
MDQETLLTLNLIKKFLKKEGQFKSSYHTPYSENEFPIEVIFKYKITKVSLHKVENNTTSRFKYEGVVYTEVYEMLQGVNGDFETGYSMDDVPEWVIDDLSEHIMEPIDKLLPHVYLELDYV